jgi:hypothetical protein
MALMQVVEARRVGQRRFAARPFGRCSASRVTHRPRHLLGMVGYAPMLRFVVRGAGNGANPPYTSFRGKGMELSYVWLGGIEFDGGVKEAIMAASFSLSYGDLGSQSTLMALSHVVAG